MDINKLLIPKNITVLQAMRFMDETAKKVLFVQEKGKLLASLTDGDVRRWILSQGSLEANVIEAANLRPKYLFEEEKYLANEFMRENRIEALPILDEDKRIQTIAFKDEEEIYIHRQDLADVPVVMMAGGLGTRLYPYTKILPKPLIPIGEVPIAEHIINQFHKFGCVDYYLILNHKKNMIKAYFNEVEKDYNVYYIDENTPLGTGGGISLLKGMVKKTFILTNCDILITSNFYKIYTHHKKEKNVITMICSLKNFQVPYGVVEIGEQGTIANMKEKPTLSFFTNTGCYLVEPEIIETIQENCPIGFPEIIEQCKKDGKKVGVYPIGEKEWLDMGELDELEKMKKMLGQEGV